MILRLAGQITSEKMALGRSCVLDPLLRPKVSTLPVIHGHKGGPGNQLGPTKIPPIAYQADPVERYCQHIVFHLKNLISMGAHVESIGGGIFCFMLSREASYFQSPTWLPEIGERQAFPGAS